MESWLPNFGNNRPVRPVKWNAPFTFALHRSSTLVLLVLWHSVWSAMHRTASLAPPHGPRRRVAPAGAGFSAQGGRDIFTTHPTHLTPPRSHLLQGSIVWLLQLLPCGTWKSEIFNRVKGSKWLSTFLIPRVVTLNIFWTEGETWYLFRNKPSALDPYCSFLSHQHNRSQQAICNQICQHLQKTKMPLAELFIWKNKGFHFEVWKETIRTKNLEQPMNSSSKHEKTVLCHHGP